MGAQDTVAQNGSRGSNGRGSPLNSVRLRKGSGSGRNVKVRLPSRAHLDGRSSAAKEFDRLAAEIQTDLGRDCLSAIEFALIEAFCGSAVLLNALNARILLGQGIAPAEHAALLSSMVPVDSRLGLHRQTRQ